MKTMKMPTLLKRKKLRATTVRRSLASPEMEYEEMSEPNMKLSRALLIVLVLHVVAVAGIVAFNSIKTRQSSPRPAAAAPAANKTAAANTSTDPAADLTDKEVAKHAHALAKPPAKTAPVRKTATATGVVDSGKTYVVAKGDNPVSIAHRFKVSYDDLLALNHIDDPRKLQIGQKLLVPKAKPKKASE